MLGLLGTAYVVGLLVVMVGVALSSFVAALVVGALAACFVAYVWATMK